MYVPTNSIIVGSITPITAIDASLHTFLGVSWMVLLPYTIFGGILMAYSQSKLMHGQRQLRKQDKIIAQSAAL